VKQETPQLNIGSIGQGKKELEKIEAEKTG
jgi:hypothetical protein